ncbi:MAG: glycosyltransferase family 4 protein [Chryseolinea sp.]
MHLPPPLHGASQSNSYLSKSELIKKSFSVDIINLQFAATVADLQTFTLRKIWKGLKYGAIIWRKVRSFKPDLVYFTLSPNGLAFYRDALYTILLKAFGCRIIFHLHGKGIKKASDSSSLHKTIYRMVFNNTQVICLTNSLHKDIDDVSFAKPFIVPYGIKVDKALCDIPFKNTNERVLILYLGNYKESKGVLILIDALTILKKKGYDFQARLVGAAADLTVEDIKKYVDGAGLAGDVLVTGPIYGSEKFAEYKAADIFAFPTFYPNEAFPLVNLEAMQFGLPVVSTNEGGIAEEIINNETGFVIEPQNVEELTDRLAKLINDAELRRGMGEKGRKVFFERYTLEHFEQNMKEVFESALSH